MPGWEQFGMQAANQGIGAALGLALGAYNDRRQLTQQRHLQNLQIAGNKELTNFNFDKQMEMWRNTSYPAQMEMLKKAGLNPALIYEGGGQGGSTGITQGSVAGGSAPVGGGEIQQMMQLGLQREMIQAQIDLTKAQTNKTNAETPNVVETGKGITLDNARKEIENSIAAIEEHVAGKTQQQRIAMYAQETESSMKKLEILRNQAEISKEQLQAEVANLWGDLANKAIDIEVKAQGIELSKAQISQINTAIWKMSEDVAQGWESLGIQDYKNVLEKSKQDWEQSGLPPMARDLMNSVTTAIIGGAIIKGGQKIITPRTKPIPGLHKRN